jgi:hypothetical protein
VVVTRPRVTYKLCVCICVLYQAAAVPRLCIGTLALNPQPTVLFLLFPTAIQLLSSAVQMSTTSKQATESPISNFISIFEASATEYKKLTKKDLHTDPFAAQFDKCDSPGAILDIFRTQASAFDEFRKGDQSLIKWLDPTVNILSTFSTTLGEGLALVVSIQFFLVTAS